MPENDRKPPPPAADNADRTETPEYGNATEKVVRERTDGKFNHGGRTQTPDADVNPAKDLHVKR